MAKNKKKKKEVEKQYGNGIAPISLGNNFNLETKKNAAKNTKKKEEKKVKKETNQVENNNNNNNKIIPVEVKADDRFTIKTPEGVQRTAEEQAAFDKKQKEAAKSIGRTTKYVGKKTALGTTQAVTGIVDAPLQNYQEGVERAKTKSTLENLKDLYLKRLLPGNLRNVKDTVDDSMKILQDPNKNNWQKAMGVAMEIGSSQGINKDIENIGQAYGLYKSLIGQDASSEIKKTRDVVNKPAEKFSEYVEKDRDKVGKTGQILGDTGQVVGNMIPSIAATIVTGGGGGSAAAQQTASLLTMGVSAKGQATREAEQMGADISTANNIGMVKGLTEVLTEKMFGGLKLFGKGSADDIVEKGLNKYVKSKGLNYLAKQGVGILGENIEEWVSDIVGVAIDKATVNPDAKYTFKDWANTGMMTVLSTLALNGLTGGYSPKSYINNAMELEKSQQTDNTQKVIENELQERLNTEYDGKATVRELAKLQAEVIEDIKNGYISTDTIEKTLGGETYTKLDEVNQKRAKLQQEINDLQLKADNNQLGSLEEKQKLNDLKEQIKTIDDTEIRNQLNQEIQETIKNDIGLQESYREVNRRTENYNVDLSKVENEKQKEVYQKAMDSGVLNNSNKTHALVDMIAKISSDKGINFDFTNNEQLEKSGFGVNGRNINGYVTDSGITINLNSGKAVNRIVGHELTHTFEGTTLYTELQDSLKDFMGNEWDNQLNKYKELYKGVKNANIENELTSDLIGDYLFTDENYVKNLSTKNKNLFEKIYDEIKYLYNVATAGSKEKRQLEKVKRTFDRIYNETESKVTSEDTKFDLSKSALQEVSDVIKQTQEEANNKKIQFVKLKDNTIKSLVDYGIEDLPMLEKSSHVRENILTEEQARKLGFSTKSKHFHGLGVKTYLEIIDSMDNPIAVYQYTDKGKYGDKNFIVVTPIEMNGKNYIVPVEINQRGQYNQVEIDYNRIKTAYAKDSSDYIDNLLNEGKIKEIFAESTSQKTSLDKLSVSQNEENVKYDISEKTIEDKINQSMTMNEAKKMIDIAFKENQINDWREDNEKYLNADEWLEDVGVDEVAMYVDNSQSTITNYTNPLYDKNIGYGEDFTTEDIIEAYKNGTLVGSEKQKANRLDLTKQADVTDSRFYSPQTINDINKVYNVANQRVNNNNREEVYKARGDFVILAHNQENVEKLGLDSKELNQTLKKWAAYSNKALELSNRLNENVAENNKWSGLENSSILYTTSVSTEELNNLVKSIDGDSSNWQRNYITSTMLALDTHINYKNLAFEFDKAKELNEKHALGDYNRRNKTIRIGNAYQNTVAHEIGHYLDNIWAEDFGFSDTANMTDKLNFEATNLSNDAKQFAKNFNLFMDDLVKSATTDSYSNMAYWQDRSEVFARFVGRFVEWTKNTASDGRFGYEDKYYKENFTQSQYEEFIKLLQEKSMLDTTGQTYNKIGETSDDIRYSLSEDTEGWNDYEAYQNELNESLNNAKNISEDFYNNMKNQMDEYKERHPLEYNIYEQTKSRPATNENYNSDFFKEHNSDYDGKSGTNTADGRLTVLHLQKGDNLAKLSFTENQEKIWIDELYVKNQKQGYGSEIVNAIKDYAERTGKYVESFKELQTAKGFWDKTLRNNTNYSLSQDSQGRELSEQQQEKFKQSKAVDREGNLLVLYHGTPNEFDTFDRDRAGSHGVWLGAGFYLTPSEENAKTYSGEKGNVKEVYANITNPYRPTADTINPDGSVNFAPSFYEDFENRFKDDIALISNWNDLNNEQKGRVVRNILQDNGYDGVISGDTYVAYEPNQIKYVNNTTPTSNDDMRYSLDIAPISKNFLTESEQEELDGLKNIENSGWTELTPEENSRMLELENKANTILNKKAEKMLRSASYKAINTSTKIAENYLDFDAKEKKTFRNELRQFSNMTKDELISADTYNKVRDLVNDYANKEINYVDDNIESIKKELKHTKIKISDELKDQITDYGYFVKDSKLMLRRNSGQSVDTVYQEYSDMYPGFFSKDLLTSADQLKALNDFINTDFTITEKYRIPDSDLKNATDIIYNKLLDNSLSMEDLVETEKILDAKAQRRTRSVVREELLKKMGITPELIQEGNDIAAISFARTDPIRVNEKVFGWDAGQKINDATVNFTKHQEAERIRFLNKERQEIKDLGIKARSKESELVQKYGEKQYVDKNNEVHEYGDAELARDVQDYATREKIKNAARVLRQKYDTYIDQVNAVLTEMGYDEIPKRKDYMRHFVELDDKFSRWGLPFNKESMSAEDLPTDINGLTEFNRPGKSYFASANTRTGLQTTYDAITGIDGYLEGVSNLIYHTESIQRYRALSRFIRENYGREHGLDNIDLMTDEELAERVKDIQDNKLSKYVAWLDEQANIIAGKKNSLDRSIERLFGRRVYTALNTLKSQVGSNMTGFNPRSAMTNFASLIQGMSKTQKIGSTEGLVSTVRNIVHDDGLMEKSDFLTSRLLQSDSLAMKPWQKLSKAGQVFMEGTDWFTANAIWRGKYYENLHKGMSEQQAIKNADDFAARIMGDRSKGATAEIFNSKTMGFLTQFQLEVNNQWSSLIHDNKIDIQKGDKTPLGVTFELGQLFAASYLFNTMMKLLTGSDVMIDPIDMMKKIFFPDDDDKDKGIVERAQEVLGEFINQLPFASMFTGGRIPIGEAFKGGTTLVKKLSGGTDNYGNKIDWADVDEDLKDSLAYWVLPTGWGQVKKTTKGLSMYDDKLPIAGSYTDSGNLRFSAEDTPFGKIKAGLFGQYSSKYAQDYIDSGYKSINASKLDEMQDLDMNSTEYREYRQGLSEAGTSVEDKLNYINSLDVPYADKDIMASNVAKKDIDMKEYNKYGSYEEFNYAQKNPAKYQVMKYLGGYDAYKNYEKAIDEIKSDYDRNGKAISNSRKNKVIQYVNSLNLTKAQKAMLIKEQYPSFTKYDKEIASYINGQNIRYIEKASILKHLGFTAYDKQIINYIRQNYRTVEEQQEELEKLGFKVYNYNGKTYVR